MRRIVAVIYHLESLIAASSEVLQVTLHAQGKMRCETGMHAGSGQYGAVGFSYGGGVPAAISDASSGSGTDFSDEDDEADGDEATDALAANLGIDNFSSMQRRAERLEEAERLGKVIKPKYACLLIKSMTQAGVVISARSSSQSTLVL